MIEAFLSLFESITFEYGLLVFVLFAGNIFQGWMNYFITSKYVENSTKTTQVITKMEVSARTNNERLEGVENSIEVIKGYFALLLGSGQVTPKKGGDE